MPVNSTSLNYTAIERMPILQRSTVEKKSVLSRLISTIKQIFENFKNLFKAHRDAPIELVLKEPKKIERIYDYTSVELDMSGEDLKKLPAGFFKQFPNVQRINVSNCDLEELPEDILQCQNLIRLNVSDNPRLEKLPKELLTMPKFFALSIAGTPFRTNQLFDFLLKAGPKGKMLDVIY